MDYPGTSRQWLPSERYEKIDREKALRRLIVAESIGQAVWDKLYRSPLFSSIRFPEGDNYEEVGIMYRIFQHAGYIALAPEAFYHYMQYKGSIVHVQSKKTGLIIGRLTMERTKNSVVRTKNTKEHVTEAAPSRLLKHGEACGKAARKNVRVK